MNLFFEWVRSHYKGWFESVRTIGLAVFIALVFRSTIAAPYRIPSGSMIPTLKIGDFIFVSKLSYGIKIPFTNRNMITYDKPKRGDVVVFMFPGNKKIDYIKRIVALEGDTVELRDDVLYINDKPMPRVSLGDRSVLRDIKVPESDGRLYRETLDKTQHYTLEVFPFGEDFGPQTIPPGHVFAMGDNRDNSKDSRVPTELEGVGMLPVENIRGRALFIWLSFDLTNWRLRWERFGRKIV